MPRFYETTLSITNLHNLSISTHVNRSRIGLNTAPFYHLVWKEENRPPIKGHTPSAKYLQEHLLYAKLDDELWELLQNAEYREFIRKSIITRFLYKK